MKILLLTHAYNCMAQRLHHELARCGHEVSVEFDINDAVTIDAVERFGPALVIAPMLKRAIPESVWRHLPCLIVHPGIVGDRGPSSLDWAILNGEQRWGVTLLQANAEMDAGDIWASREFVMRATSKSSLYRREVTQAALEAVLEAVSSFEQGDIDPVALAAHPGARGQWRCLMRQDDRAIDWLLDDSHRILTKINSADGNPGLRDELLGVPVYLHNARLDGGRRGPSGQIIAKRLGSVCIGTGDGAIWIGHLRAVPSEQSPRTLKLPAVQVLEQALGAPLSARDIPELPAAFDNGGDCHEIHYRVADGVGYLYFEFYNGAMDTDQCRRLLSAYRELNAKPLKAIVLMGGKEFWSNGIHLNRIEAAESPSEASWENINAMNDLTRAIIETTDKLTLAVIRGNAGAGGVFLALAADRVVARDSVVLNPHYKAMGNLYGSEYWTYLLPRRVGEVRARQITDNRLPIGVAQAVEWGLVDLVLPAEEASADAQVLDTMLATELAPATYQANLMEKRRHRQRDEAERPLASYRQAELERMRLNFFGFDPSYHVARHQFVYKRPKSRTPPYLARHRRACA